MEITKEQLKEFKKIKEIDAEINSYLSDIDRLIEMAKIYEIVENLNGAFYDHMVTEIEEQIKHCKHCIKNLQKSYPNFVKVRDLDELTKELEK